MDLLRFFTAGNVDDGKSTLIGRLLLDSHAISTDIIETLTKQSKNATEKTSIDLALLTDGLRAEREQGITIDVAYKYFSTSKRKYIIADTPGHTQYTRNMFTGASTADLAILMIDARHGVTEQTKRHTIISAILGIPHLVICINKMDLTNYDQKVFVKIQQEFIDFSSPLANFSLQFIPVSALLGENVVHSSKNMRWYEGPSLFHYIETIDLTRNKPKIPSRFQVQYVIRPQTEQLPDYRGYAGTVISGNFSIYDEVIIFPLERKIRIVKIEKNQIPVQFAAENEPVVLHFEEDFDIGRGSSIVKTSELPLYSDQLEATICWMDNKPFVKDQKFMLQHNSLCVKAVIKEVVALIDVNTAKEVQVGDSIELNDICKVSLKLSTSIAYDTYSTNRKNGAFILINEITNNTVAAGVLL